MPFDDNVREEIESAVRRGVPRQQIIDVFTGRASRAAIYRWVQNATSRLTEVATADIEEMSATPPIVHNVVVSLPKPTTIPYLERLNSNLRILDDMLAMAIREGQIKNTRLALDVIKEVGAQLSRAARINADIQDIEAQRRFMRALAEIIHEEEPEIRDRIVRKMREVGVTGGIIDA